MANEIIRPSELTPRSSPVASEVVPSDNGSTVAGVTWANGVNAGRPLASQVEAEAGVQATKAMTPLTTKQAIDAQVPGKISTAISSLNLGTASQASVGDFATAAQGNLADTAVQPGDPGTVPAGGALGQVLAKASASDHDVAWVDQTGGGVEGPGSSVDGDAVVFDGVSGNQIKSLGSPPLAVDGSNIGNDADQEAFRAAIGLSNTYPEQYNPIINGDMIIRQNAATASSAVDGTQVADRWTYNKIGSAVHTVSESSDVPTVAQAGRLYIKSMKLTLTTPNDVVAATDEVVIVQKIEGTRFRDIAQRDMKIKFWAKATLPGIYTISLRNDVVDRSCVIPFTISAIDTWELIVLDMPASPASGTWVYDNSGAGLRFGIVLMAGSNYQAPSADEWLTGYYHTVSGAVNGCQTGATEFLFTGVDIYPADGYSNVARSFEDELALCRRIRRRYSGLPDNAIVLSGVAVDANLAVFPVHGMRALSGISYGGSPKVRLEGVGSSGVTGMSIAAGSIEGIASIFVSVGGGLVAGAAVSLCTSGSADFIDISGEF